MWLDRGSEADDDAVNSEVCVELVEFGVHVDTEENLCKVDGLGFGAEHAELDDGLRKNGSP